MKGQEVRVVVAGCQRIAIDVIKFVNERVSIGSNEDGYIFPKLVGVITHDEERDRLLSHISVSEYCFISGIPSIRFDKKIDVDTIKMLKPDLIISAYYRKILSKEIIELPKMGCINIHPGYLPQDRGSNPTYWNVRRGDRYAGVTLHYIDEGMDTGDMLSRRAVEVNGRTGYELNKYLMEVGFELFSHNYDDFMSGNLMSIKQDDSRATCNIKFTNNHRYIDWCQPAENIVNHVRAHASPYAGSMVWTPSKDPIRPRPHIWTVESAKVLKQLRSSKGPGSFNGGLSGEIIVQTHTCPVLVKVTSPIKDSGRFGSGVPE